MILARNRKLREQEIQTIAEDIFAKNPQVYDGYSFVSAPHRSDIAYVCRNGHEKLRIQLSNIRSLQQCGSCVLRKGHDAEVVKRRVLDVWQRSPKFYGSFRLKFLNFN